MTAGGKCGWCDGRGTAHPGTVIESTCGWCDGTGVQKPDYHGHGGPGEHRTLGPIRAWCDCGHYCYRNDPCDCCFRFEAETRTSADPDCRIHTVVWGEHDTPAQLHVIHTDEGIVIDLYDEAGDVQLGTAAITADELAEMAR